MKRRLNDILVMPDVAPWSDGEREARRRDAAYRAAFEAYGIPILESTDRAVELIVRSSISAELISALDDWAFARRRLGDGRWKQLLDISSRVDQDEPSNQFRSLILNGQSNEAAERALEVSKQADLPVSTAILMARYLMSHQMWQEAVEALEARWQDHVDHLPLALELTVAISSYMENVDSGPTMGQRALGYARAALGIDRSSAAGWNLYADILYKLGDVEAAVHAVRRAVALQPEDPILWFNMASLIAVAGSQLQDAGLEEEAVQAAAAFRERATENQRHQYIWNFYSNREESISEREAATVAFPKSWKAWNRLGIALAPGERKVEAYRTSIHLTENVKSYQAYFPYKNLGQYYSDTGRLDDAINVGREAVSRFPERPAPHANLALYLEHRGYLDDAILHARKALELDKRRSFHSLLGNLLCRKGEYEKALVLCWIATTTPEEFNFNNGRESQGQEFLYEFWHGFVLTKLGQYEEAAGAFERAVDLDERNQEARTWREDALYLWDYSDKLTEIVEGREVTENGKDLRYAARFASHKKLYAASARLWESVVEIEGPDEMEGWWDEAGAAAAQAGTGIGRDAVDLDPEERLRLRRLALEWLRADLEESRGQIESGDPQGLRDLGRLMDGLFYATVRGEALERLPPEEAEEWKAFWDEVGEILNAEY